MANRSSVFGRWLDPELLRQQITIPTETPCPPERSEAPAERSRRTPHPQIPATASRIFTTNPKPPTGSRTSERLNLLHIDGFVRKYLFGLLLLLTGMGSFDSARLAPRCAQEDSEDGRHRDKNEDEVQGPRRRRSSLCVCPEKIPEKT